MAYLAITYQQEHLEANLKAKLIALLLISLFLYTKKTTINILNELRN
ncbi:hypothetical protein CU024_1739 [Enterococcus faecium]|nr:hypothetical protein [Enterococcus faecium]MBK4788248.1 hypothetical protein [Enterococcus faecium]MBK4875442.1 hypothetical protein [Enterococcus faecium]